MEKETKQGLIATLHSFGIPYATAIISPFLESHPEWMGAWYSAIGLYGVYMQYNQDKLNEFIEFIRDNPNIFIQNIVKTDEFKEGFLITFQEFIKARGERKREIVKRIFLGFTTASDKENFRLEKLYSTLANISLEAIFYLIFVRKDIHPTAEKACELEVKKLKEREIPYWDEELCRINFKKQNPITVFIRKELDKKYGINNTEAKKLYQHIQEPHEKINVMDKDMKKEVAKLAEISSELISLGIWRKEIKDQGLGTIGGGYITEEAEFTEFGLNFLNFIQEY